MSNDMQASNPYAPPWPTRTLWCEANSAMARAIEGHKPQCDRALELGQRIRQRIQALDGPMDTLCSRTCPTCTDSCCAHARVWYDFKDLVYLHLGAQAIPPGQLIGTLDQTCRYLTSAGCSLPRVQRPFVCTWYFCAAQKSQMNYLPRSGVQFLHHSLEALKSGRNRLEDLFIKIVT